MHDDESTTPAVVRQGSKSRQTRRRILDAAAAVFAERGYGETRLSDIAELTGMKAGSFYYHFPSKEALIAEVLKQAVEAAFASARAAVARLPSNASAGERLRAAITAHTMVSLGTPSYTAAHVRLIGQVPAEIRREHYVRDQEPYGRFWEELFSEAARNHEIRDDLNLLQVRMLILGAVNWAVEWPRPLRQNPKETAEILIAMVFDGMAPRK